jgi:ribosomal protein S27E
MLSNKNRPDKSEPHWTHPHPLHLLRCQYCMAPLHFEPDRGYLHPNGELFAVKCVHCGHILTSKLVLAKCPACGKPTAWTYDHIATPVSVNQDE